MDLLHLIASLKWIIGEMTSNPLHETKMRILRECNHRDCVLCIVRIYLDFTLFKTN